MLTIELAEQADTTVKRVHDLLRAGRLRRPPMNRRGEFTWDAADVEAVKVALATPRKAGRKPLQAQAS